MTHMIDELYRKTVAFSPTISLDEMLITLKLRESSFQKVTEALAESHELEMDVPRDQSSAQFQQEAPPMTV